MPLIDLNGLGHFKDKENAMIANDYSASSTYAVGDYVFYNGTLYKCKTAITTAEAWTSGHWEAAVLTDSVSELNTNLNEEIDSIIDRTKLTLDYSDVRNVYVSSVIGEIATYTASSASKTIVNAFPVVKNKFYCIKITDGNSVSSATSRTSVIVDAENIVQSLYSYTAADNKISKIEFSSPIDGFFVLCLDKNYKSIEVTEENFDLLPNTEQLIANHSNDTIAYCNQYTNLPTVPGSRNASCIGLKVQNNVITLNGENTTGGTVHVKLSGNAARTAITNTAAGWSRDLDFKKGHKYRVTIKNVSGTKNEKYIGLNFYRTNTNSAVFATTVTDEKTWEFTWAWDEKALMRLWINADVVVNEYRLVIILQDITAIKDQYIDEMSVTESEVKSSTTEPCLVFPLLTDIHYLSPDSPLPRQFEETIKNVDELSKRVPFDGLLCLGDITDGAYGSDKSTIADVLYEMQKMTELGIPLFFTVGNHDDYRYSNNAFLKSGDIYANYMRWSEKKVIPDANMAGTNYYIDFSGYNTRLVSINTNKFGNNSAGSYGVSEETLEWFGNVLTSTPEAYIVLLITHAPIYRDLLWTTSTEIPGVGNLRTLIKNSGKTCITLSGHTHFDIVHRGEEENGVLNVVIGCSKYDDFEYLDVTTYGGQIANRYARNQSDKTTELWDVVIVKPFMRKIIFDRFGAGVNRIVNIDTITVTEEVTLNTELSGNITWSSSNAEVVTVVDGVLTPIATGYSTIKATDVNGNYEWWQVHASVT